MSGAGVWGGLNKRLVLYPHQRHLLGRSALRTLHKWFSALAEERGGIVLHVLVLVFFV